VFGFFKSRQPEPPYEPPTEKQIRYAKKLRIEVARGMSRFELSALIAEAEVRNPRLAREREAINSKRREREYGKELIEEEAWWGRKAERRRYMVAVYKDRQEIVVDVLSVGGAEITGPGSITLAVSAPKLRHDRYIGEYLDWDRDFELPLKKLLHHEWLHEGFHADGIDAYREVVERGLKAARRL
jgi:hypothetical protein